MENMDYHYLFIINFVLTGKIENIRSLDLNVQVLALASLTQVLVRVQLAHSVHIQMKCDLYAICMEQYSIFCQ